MNSNFLLIDYRYVTVTRDYPSRQFGEVTERLVLTGSCFSLS